MSGERLQDHWSSDFVHYLWNFDENLVKNRGPLVLYCSPECWGYVELEQTWKYISTQCCISFHPCRSIWKQIWPCHKNSQGQPKVIIWNIGSTRVPDAVYHVSKSSASWFRRKRFLKFFTIIYKGMVMWPGTFEQIFIPHISWRLHMKFGFNLPSSFWAKEVWICWISVTLDEVQWMTLTFDIHNGSCTHLVDWIYQLWYHRLQQFLKNPLFYLFPI